MRPGARMAFMHPVKSRRAISAAYFDYGVRTFSLDTHEELAKIIDATGAAKDLNLMVRLAVAGGGLGLSAGRQVRRRGRMRRRRCCWPPGARPRT